MGTIFGRVKEEEAKIHIKLLHRVPDLITIKFDLPNSVTAFYEFTGPN